MHIASNRSTDTKRERHAHSHLLREHTHKEYNHIFFINCERIDEKPNRSMGNNKILVIIFIRIHHKAHINIYIKVHDAKKWHKYAWWCRLYTEANWNALTI